jgi:putative redox protein
MFVLTSSYKANQKMLSRVPRSVRHKSQLLCSLKRCYATDQPKYIKSYKITATNPIKTRTDVQADKHTITFDEPERLGGTDAGPTPLHALLGSLCGCETATAHYFARKMQFDLGKITFTHVEGILDTRGFSGVDPNAQVHYLKVIMEATVETSETQERLNELKKKVEKHCPVYAMFAAAKTEMQCKWVVVPKQ